MKRRLLGGALVGVGKAIGAVSSNTTNGTANAQLAPPGTQSGDALWHLPRFGERAGGSYTLTTDVFVRVTWTR